MRFKRHLNVFKKLKNIVLKHADNSLFYVRTFMSRILGKLKIVKLDIFLLEVPTLDIPEADVMKFVEFLKSDSLPNPNLTIAQIILQSILGDDADLSEFLPKIRQPPLQTAPQEKRTMLVKSATTISLMQFEDKELLMQKYVNFDFFKIKIKNIHHYIA